MNAIADLISPLLNNSAKNLDTFVVAAVLAKAYQDRGVKAEPTVPFVQELLQHSPLTVSYDGKGNEANFVAVVAYNSTPVAIFRGDTDEAREVHLVNDEMVEHLMRTVASVQRLFAQGSKTKEPPAYPVHYENLAYPRWTDGKRDARLVPDVFFKPTSTVYIHALQALIAKQHLFAIRDGEAQVVVAYHGGSDKQLDVSTASGERWMVSPTQFLTLQGSVAALDELLPKGVTLQGELSKVARREATWQVAYLKEVPGVGCEVEVNQALPGQVTTLSYRAWQQGATALESLLPYLKKLNPGYFTADAVKDKLGVIWVQEPVDEFEMLSASSANHFIAA